MRLISGLLGCLMIKSNNLFHKNITLISKKEIEEYYSYLLNAFKKEVLGGGGRKIIENLNIKSVFSKNDEAFFIEIVKNAFKKKNPYSPSKNLIYHLDYPIELIDYIVKEGYTPSSPFVIWVYKKYGIKWNPFHWYISAMRDIAPVDLSKIRKELKKIKRNKLPMTLEFYYRLGTGLERVHVHPDIGVRKVLMREFSGTKKYKGFDPIDYLDYYYGGLDKEDMTIAKTLYELLLKHRTEIPNNSKVLIVGNGPVPDEAQTLSMIPEIRTIIPSDIDARNINIIKMHTKGRNPLATQKARPGEEHADFIYYLFEKYTKAKYGMFAVREITSVKTTDPVFVDVSLENPLDMPQNNVKVKNLSPDLVLVPFCPESITNNLENYSRYIKNISFLIKPKKHLCMLALKNAKFYISGVKKLNAVPIDEKIIYKELIKNKFTNVEILTIKTNLDKKKRGFSDSMIIWATKK